jgi:hypothetical protein
MGEVDRGRVKTRHAHRYEDSEPKFVRFFAICKASGPEIWMTTTPVPSFHTGWTLSESARGEPLLKFVAIVQTSEAVGERAFQPGAVAPSSSISSMIPLSAVSTTG